MNNDLYKRFMKEHPEHAGLTYSQFKEIVLSTHLMMVDEVINSRDGIDFPEGLGHVFIGTCNRPKKKNYDWVKSRELKQGVTYRNFESDNYLAKIFYTNYSSKYRFKDSPVWKFTAYRKFSRAVSKVYPEKWKTYVQVDNYQLISRLYGRHRTRDLAIKLAPSPDENYNEFKMD
jgi:hypothetical protein